MGEGGWRYLRGAVEGAYMSSFIERVRFGVSGFDWAGGGFVVRL